MNSTPTSEQWKLFHRMRAAGCPIDYGHLSLPSRPFAIVNHPLPLNGGGATNVARWNGSTWIALSLEIRVTSTVRFGALRLRAPWLAGEAPMVKPCLEHEESYCLPQHPDGQHVKFPSSGVLNRWSQRNGFLSRGEYCRGYILAEGTDFLLTSPATYLDAQVCFDNWVGKEMVFPVVLANSKVPI